MRNTALSLSQEFRCCQTKNFEIFFSDYIFFYIEKEVAIKISYLLKNFTFDVVLFLLISYYIYYIIFYCIITFDYIYILYIYMYMNIYIYISEFLKAV